jgi:tetratricopeptide (TPR) repeat protein
VANTLAKAQAQQAIAVKLAELGDFDSALKLAKNIRASRRIVVETEEGRLGKLVPDDTSKTKALVDISGSLAKAQKMDEARQTIDAIGNRLGKVRAAAAVSLVLDQQGEHAKAESLLDGAAAGAEEDAWLLVALAEGYRRIGKQAAAGPLLDRAVRLTNSAGIEGGGAELRLQVAEECFAAGRRQKAVKMLDDTFRAVKTTKYEAVRQQLYLLKEMARISARAGRFDRAREMAKAIGDEDYDDEALLEVVKAYADARQAKQAYELARAIEYPDHRVAALAAAAGAWLAAGQRANAAEALTLAMAAMPKSPDDVLNAVHHLLEIEVRYREGGLLPDAAAKATLRELLGSADRAATARTR